MVIENFLKAFLKIPTSHVEGIVGLLVSLKGDLCSGNSAFKRGCPMRDLVYKNLTSQEKGRKIISSFEVVDKEGVRSTIRRHFVCIFKEVGGLKQADAQEPSLSVIREKNSREQRERFSCKIKGRLSAEHNGRSYLIYYLHSLNINLIPLEGDSLKQEDFDTVN